MPSGVYPRKPISLCKCGNNRKPLFIKGVNKGYLKTCGEYQCAKQIGTNNYRWQGGKTIDKNGYILVLDRNHPKINKSGISRYRREHVMVMEEYLGRKLNTGEVVHHIDGNRQNNKIENLQLFSSNAEHLKLELTNRPYRQGWNYRKEKYAEVR